ncbi:MAG TPA: hypothetical protein VEH06_09140, partial [Candidatus Bathyarchaeia archaeon]|nr:hypothetical protein [Candidatus Bathyarchaeia archaeon]
NKALKGSNFKHQWTELLDAVCKSNTDNGRWISEYIREIFALKNKKKLRGIRTRLKEYASSHKDKILILSLSPLTLAWRETYTGEDRDAAVDIDNVMDPEDAEEQSYAPTPATPTPPTPKSVQDNTNNEGIQGISLPTESPSGSPSGSPKSAQSAQSALSPNTVVMENADPNKQELIDESPKTYDESLSESLKVNNESPRGTQRLPLTIGQKSFIKTGDLDKSKIVENEPSEDYETYVAKQKKIFDAEEQKLTAQRIFDDLASKNAKMNPGTEKEVLEPKFREALMSNGFNDDSINAIIRGMENDRIIERVGTELDGIRCDILRVIN